jgi:hypothetical protein
MRSYKCFARRSLFGLRCRKILRPVESILKISPTNRRALPQPKFSAFARIADGGPILLFENLSRQISENNDERLLITIQSTSRKLAAVFMFISLALGSQTIAVGRYERAFGRQIA